MKYSVVMVTTAPSNITKTSINSVKAQLNYDEFILVAHKVARWEREKGLRHGDGSHKGILKARNNYVLLLDDDVFILDGPQLETALLESIQKENVFTCGPIKYFHPGEKIDMILAPIMMIDKKMYLDNGVKFTRGNAPTFKMMIEGVKRRGQVAEYLPFGEEPPYVDLKQRGSVFIHFLKGNHYVYPVAKQVLKSWTIKVPQMLDYVVDEGYGSGCLNQSYHHDGE